MPPEPASDDDTLVMPPAALLTRLSSKLGVASSTIASGAGTKPNPTTGGASVPRTEGSSSSSSSSSTSTHGAKGKGRLMVRTDSNAAAASMPSPRQGKKKAPMERTPIAPLNLPVRAGSKPGDQPGSANASLQPASIATESRHSSSSEGEAPPVAPTMKTDDLLKKFPGMSVIKFDLRDEKDEVETLMTKEEVKISAASRHVQMQSKPMFAPTEVVNESSGDSTDYSERERRNNRPRPKPKQSVKDRKGTVFRLGPLSDDEDDEDDDDTDDMPPRNIPPPTRMAPKPKPESSPQPASASPCTTASFLTLEEVSFATGSGTPSASSGPSRTPPAAPDPPAKPTPAPKPGRKASLSVMSRGRSVIRVETTVEDKPAQPPPAAKPVARFEDPPKPASIAKSSSEDEEEPQGMRKGNTRTAVAHGGGPSSALDTSDNTNQPPSPASTSSSCQPVELLVKNRKEEEEEKKAQGKKQGWFSDLENSDSVTRDRNPPVPRKVADIFSREAIDKAEREERGRMGDLQFQDHPTIQQRYAGIIAARRQPAGPPLGGPSTHDYGSGRNQRATNGRSFNDVINSLVDGNTTADDIAYWKNRALQSEREAEQRAEIAAKRNQAPPSLRALSEGDPSRFKPSGFGHGLSVGDALMSGHSLLAPSYSKLGTAS